MAAGLDAEVFEQPSLNALMSLGPGVWAEGRELLQSLLDDDESGRDVVEPHLHPLDSVTMHLPIEVADYVDFYASEHHAANVGAIFRPGGPPLTPNWKHQPIGYHGRAGTVVPSGTPVVRPNGQRKAPDDEAPTFGPSRRLDIEAELGFVVGVGSRQGTSVGVDAFADHVFGVVVLNDWSARDLQAWEYVPLGPFLGKSFATSISAWVLPLAALEPARRPLPPQDPPLLDYLRGDLHGLRRRRRGLAERLPGQHLPVRRHVLLAGPDGRPPDQQRGLAADRGPAGLGNHLRAVARPARIAVGADLERLTAAAAGRRGADVPGRRGRGRAPRARAGRGGHGPLAG